MSNISNGISINKAYTFWKVFVLTTLLFSFSAYAKYSQRYNLEIHQLTFSNLKVAEEKSRLLLNKAEESGNVKNQLIALFYIVESLINSENTSELEKLIEQGLNLSIENNNLTFKAEFLRKKAFRLQLKGMYSDATMVVNQALEVAENSEDNRLIAETLLTRAEVQISIQNNELALQDVEEAIRVFKENNDFLNLSLSYNLLALIYQSLGDLDNSIKYFKEGILVEGSVLSMNQVIYHYNIGNAYEEKNEFENAIKHFKISRDMSKAVNDNSIENFINFSMAEIYLEKNNYSKSEELISLVFEPFKKSNDLLMLFNSHVIMAEIKVETGNFDSALYHFNIIEEQVKLLKTPNSKLKYLDKKILYYVRLQKWQKAYELRSEEKRIRVEVNNKSKEKMISQLKVKLNVKFDQEKLQFLQEQNNYQQRSIIQEKSKQKYLWGLIVLSILLLLFSYYGYRTQKKVKQHLYNSSITDYLTKVKNRRHMIYRLKTLYDSSKNKSQSLSIVMIDFDYFKVVNDTYGHDVGNEVLIYFAKVAQEIMQDIGEVGRIGGEEWLILLPNVAIDMIKVKMADLRKVYGAAKNNKIPEGCQLTFSSGVLTNSNKYQCHEDMLKDVDLAMYQAKKQGRNQDIYI